MPYWMWIGNVSTQYNATPLTNLTAAEVTRINGYGAAGPSELKPVMMNGQILGGNFQTTFNPSHPNGTAMNYTSPTTDLPVTGARITTAVTANFRVYDIVDGNEVLVGTYGGLFVQMNNGDTFFRPTPTTAAQWEPITSLYRIEISGAAAIPNNTPISSTVGFNPSISDIEIVPCFTRGTMIETPQGPRLIEELAVGDLVITKDHGPQPLCWIGSRSLDAVDLQGKPHLRPIRIAAGALGAGMPATELLVSPQHRILVRSKIAQRMFGTDEALVAAKQLVLLEGIDIADDLTQVDYFHIMFDHHQVVFSNQAATESLFTGPEALKAIGPKARQELFELFPHLASPDFAPVPARIVASGRQARKLASRHKLNAVPLLS